jgi:hypothetical protein
MKLSQVLLPEIVADKRGPLEAREFYRRSLEYVAFDGCRAILDHTFPHKSDGALLEHLVLCKSFKRESSPKIYYIPAGFGSALSKIDREIPIQYMPKNFFGYIHLGEGAVNDGSEDVEGGHVWVGPASKCPLYLGDSSFDPEAPIFLCSYIGRKKSEASLSHVSRLCFELEPKKLAEILSKYTSFDYHDNKMVPTSEEAIEKRKPVFRLFLNVVMYINSLDPELLKLRPLHEMTHSQRRKWRETHNIENDCAFPVTLVNWSYGEKLYNVDSTVVQGHFRWQPCGSGRSQVKLTWVREHERHYQNTKVVETSVQI